MDVADSVSNLLFVHVHSLYLLAVIIYSPEAVVDIDIVHIPII